MKTVVRRSGSMVAMALLGFASAALAASTPVIRQLAVVGPNSLRLIYDNAGQNPFRDGDTAFVNVDGKTDPSAQNLGLAIPPAGFGLTAPMLYQNSIAFSLVISNLGPGEHCYRMWGIDVYGDVSDKPSAWICATLPSSVPPAEILPTLAWFKPPLVMATFSDRKLFLEKPGTADLDLVTGGYVQLVPTGMDCRPPWRKVSYQNGGWYNLGAAHYLSWNDPFWMCWVAQLPAAARITYPPLPAPRVTR